MPISKETIEELREIMKEDYGLETTKDEAEEIAYSLVGYFDLLNKIKNENENENRRGVL